MGARRNGSGRGYRTGAHGCRYRIFTFPSKMATDAASEFGFRSAPRRSARARGERRPAAKNTSMTVLAKMAVRFASSFAFARRCLRFLRSGGSAERERGEGSRASRSVSTRSAGNAQPNQREARSRQSDQLGGACRGLCTTTRPARRQANRAANHERRGRVRHVL